MKKMAQKALCLLLCLLLTLSLLSFLPTLAATDTSFIFSALEGSEAVYSALGASVTLPLHTDTVYKAKGLQLSSEKSNAIYLSLVNNTNATAVRLTYTYEENAAKITQSVEQALVKGSTEQQVLTVFTPHIMQNVTALELSFVTDGPPAGSIVLTACFNVSAYAPDAYTDANGEPWAEILRCHYDKEKQLIEFAGELSYAAMVHYTGQTLALFTLDAKESLYLYRKTPVARAGMSLNFSFSVPAKSADDLFARYVVAAVNDQGASTPLCSPLYPVIPTGDVDAESAFKGFHSTTLSTVLDCVPGVEIVDVYLDKLQTAQNTGVLYVGEHAYYYFDEDYVASIDGRVRSLTGMGTHVYLRFLVSADANNLSFVDFSESNVGVINKLPVIRSTEAQHDIHAFTDFLTARYADASIGRISGIVLGRSADRADSYSYTAATDLSEYAGLYASLLNLVASTARQNLSGCRIIVPLSDRIFPQTVGATQVRGDYYTERFLSSLLCALDAQVLLPQQFSVMLESEQIPRRISGAAGEGYGTDRLEEFLKLLMQQNRAYPYLCTDIFYSFMLPAQAAVQDLKAAYLMQYITLLRNGMVDSFLLDASLAEVQGNHALTRDLALLARYIDTDRFSSVCATAIAALGVNSLEEIFQGFSEAELRKRKIYTATLTEGAYASDAAVSGSYRFFDFSVATDTLGWYAGSECSDLSVLTDSQKSRSLTAQLSGASDYGSIAYHFQSPVNLSFAPLMAFESAIEGTAGTRYELQLRLIGTAQVISASAIVAAGEKRTLYFDLSAKAAALGSLQAVQLIARPLDGNTEDFKLCLYSFDLESAVLSDAEMSERVNEILKSFLAGEAEPVSKRDYKVPLIVTSVVVLCSAALIVFLINYNSGRTKKRRDENK